MSTTDPTMLICLPFAGSAASFYRAWKPLAPESLDILPIQLPGREERFVEAFHTDAATAADEAYDQISGQLESGPRVAVFGHSLGAILAFELARRIERSHRPELSGLFVSGSPGPWTGRTRRATGLSDDEFVARVRSFAGYSHPVLDNPEMRDLLLPLLRADVQMHEDYRPGSREPLASPVVALRGREDELVDHEQILQWSESTTGAFDTATFDGGHMYLTDGAAELLAAIAGRLTAVNGR